MNKITIDKIFVTNSVLYKVAYSFFGCASNFERYGVGVSTILFTFVAFFMQMR